MPDALLSFSDDAVARRDLDLPVRHQSPTPRCGTQTSVNIVSQASRLRRSARRTWQGPSLLTFDAALGRYSDLVDDGKGRVFKVLSDLLDGSYAYPPLGRLCGPARRVVRGFPTRVRRGARVSSRVDGIDPGGGLQDCQAVPRLQDCPERAVSRRKGRGRAPCGAAELHDRRSREVLGPGVLQRPTLSGVPSVGGIPDTAYESRGGGNQDESSLFARIGGFSRTLSAPLNSPVVHDGGGTLFNKLLKVVPTPGQAMPGRPSGRPTPEA